jgi:hypothetical protein
MDQITQAVNAFGPFLAKHWKALLAGYVAWNAIAAMPSPNGTGLPAVAGLPQSDRQAGAGAGVTATWWYKWIFGTLHGVTNLPRLVATLFPNSPAGKLILSGTTRAKSEPESESGR